MRTCENCYWYDKCTEKDCVCNYYDPLCEEDDIAVEEYTEDMKMRIQAYQEIIDEQCDY